MLTITSIKHLPNQFSKKFLPERLEHQSKPIIRFQQTDWSNSNHHYNGFERRLVCVVLKFVRVLEHFTTESGTFSCLKSNRSVRKIFPSKKYCRVLKKRGEYGKIITVCIRMLIRIRFCFVLSLFIFTIGVINCV